MIAKLARHPETGNISFWIEPQHPDFPPMSLPASDFPTPGQSTDYADALLRACRVISQTAQPVWTPCGYTIGPNDQRTAAWASRLPT